MRELRNCGDCGLYRVVTYVAAAGLSLCGACAKKRVEAATATAAATGARIRHPVARVPSYRCYRVVRHYRSRGSMRFENLGGYMAIDDALRVASTEIGRARVLDPRGHVVSDNLQPIEDRP